MIAEKNSPVDSEDIELELFLEAVNLKYGYDFRGYSRAHLKRRLKHRVGLAGFSSISEMQNKVLNDESLLGQVLVDLSINVTEMFRDPSFYLTIRKEVVPILKTYPHVKIWHAGCSSGEEVYSMAILLMEEGLYKRATIYATDFNEIILRKAQEGIYRPDDIQRYTLNYQKAGGRGSFSDYYDAKYDSIRLDERLRENIVFADHNLVTDGVFGEMHLIFCRNVLIYFQKELQSHVVGLLTESLLPGGFLCLGSKESLRFSGHEDDFGPFSEKEKIYCKKRQGLTPGT